MSKLDRVGEVGYNNFGSELIIIEYRRALDIDVYFPEYDWIFKGATYQHFKNGKVKCPYEPRAYNHGYIGEGKYKSKENGKYIRIYTIWNGILQRCYDEKYHERNHTYIGCKASEEFHNFQNFGYWDNENYYEIENEVMCLDKDILVKGNKLYSSETCIYVPEQINKLFTKGDKLRGDLPIGVSYHKASGKFQARCKLYFPETGKSKLKHLGYYETSEQAFEVYKEFKENHIKEVADYYKDKIPTKLYDVMYNYQVEITD